MSQDTRKDKRAKVVSLNVRYKSATVDEFIENHSHDVSKGGIFVKTPTPFPPGTLLKFEIRLAGDKSVISGVGRVVWKREPTQASPDKPAGMGVKFIKIDDASRAVIDRLIASKADAGSAYTSDPAALEDEKAGAGVAGGVAGALGAAPGGPAPTTLRGIPAAAPSSAPSPPGASGRPLPAPPPSPAKIPAPAPSSTPAIAKSPTAGAGSAVGGRPAGGRLDKTIPMGASPLAGMMQAKQSASGAAPPPAASSSSPAAGPPRAGSTSLQTSPGPVGPGPGAAGPPPPMQHKPATAIGVGPGPSQPHPPPAAAAGNIPPAPRSEPRLPNAPPRPPANPRKATMMGVGLPASGSAPGAEKKLDTSSTAPGDMPTPFMELTPAQTAAAASAAATAAASTAPTAPPPAGPMFPKMEESKKDLDSVKEPTVMKQAAELLEEALREAGGSMEEIGQNPLFMQSSQRDGAVHEQKTERNTSSLASLLDDHAQSGDTLMMQSPMAPKASVTPSAPPLVQPTPPPGSVTPSPPSVQPAQPARSVPPTPLQPIGASVARPEKKGGGGLIAGLLVVAVLVGGGVYAYKSGALAGIIGGGAPTATATTSAAPSASVSSPASASSSAAPVSSAGADASVAATSGDGGDALVATGDGGAATATGDGGAAAAGKDAGAAVVATVKPAPPPQPKPRPKPPPTQPTSTDTETPPPAPTPTTTTTTTPEDP